VTFGTYAKITRRIFLEPYCGIGFRHLAEHRLNIEGLQSQGSSRHDNGVFNAFLDEDNVEGEFSTIYFPCGVKLNFLL
jgi:hypothetical protein